MRVEALLGTDRAFAADLDRAAPAARAGGQRGEPARAARRLGDRRQPPRGRPARAGRLLAALRAAGARRGARHVRPRRVGRRDRARRGDRQPDGAARRAGRVVRQLPRRAARASRATSSRSPPPRSARSPSGVPTGCSTPARSHGLPPFLAPDAGRQLGADDRPVHAGRDGGREPAARRAGERRLAADQRDAGGPRLDGLGGGAQAAHGRSPTCADPRGRARLRGARRSSCARRSRPAPAPARRSRRPAPASRAPGPTAGWRRSSRGRRAARRRRVARGGRSRDRGARNERPARGPRPARPRALAAAAGSRRRRCAC